MGKHAKPEVVQHMMADQPQKPTRAFTTRSRPWETGFFRRLPWSGFLTIFLALGCTAAAIAIGIASDGKPVGYWTVDGHVLQPAVLLSIAATLTNTFLVFAFTKGATIHWWNMAFEGTTLKQLHSSYHYGSGVIAIFTSARSVNLVALASISMPILLMNGPLLQRASSVSQKVHMSQANLSIPISSAPFIQGATGVVPAHRSIIEPNLYHPMFAEVLRQYTNRVSVTLPDALCEGNCTAEIIAPGWDIECSQSEHPYRLATYDEMQELASEENMFQNGTVRPNSTYSGPEEVQTVFEVLVGYKYTVGDVEEVADQGGRQFHLDLSSLYKSTTGGNGTFSSHNCTLYEAIVKYPLQLAAGQVTLGPMPLSENRTVQRVTRQEESQGMTASPSTLGGFWLAINAQFNTSANMRPVGGWYSLETTSQVSSQYLRAPNASAIETFDITWSDPMEDMILMANELAFRTAHAISGMSPDDVRSGSMDEAGPSTDAWNLTSEQPYILSPNLTFVQRPLSQDSTVSGSKLVPIYNTHRGWVAGSTAVVCFACLAILSTYWGWWRLGRQVSMSPLEIARAFGAPLLETADPNATGDDLKKELGTQKIRFAVDAQGRLHEERPML